MSKGQDVPTFLDHLNTFTSELQRAHLAEVNVHKKEVERLKELLATKEQEWLQEKRKLLEENERINKLYIRARDLVEKSNPRKRHIDEASLESHVPTKRPRLATPTASNPPQEISSNEDDNDALNETVAPLIENDILILEKTSARKETKENDLFDEINSGTPPINLDENGRTPPLSSLSRASQMNDEPSPKLISIDLVHDAETEKATPRSRLIVTPSTKTKRLPLSRSPSNTALELFGKTGKNDDDLISLLADAANPSSSIPIPTASRTPQYKYQEDRVYGKAERAKLPAHECPECAKFYDALFEGDENNPERHRRVQHCGRHRTLFAAPSTPPGFWDIDFDSQEKKSKSRERDKSSALAGILDDSF